MKLRIKRIAKRDTYTIGRLYVSGVRVCDTLEDTDRGLKDTMSESYIIRKKVYGRTAIPTGTYHLDMDTVSPKFQYRSWAKPYGGKLPRILSVKGFEGVLIHPLNTADESYGCIGVGENKVVGKIVNSQKTFSKLMNEYLRPAYLRGEDIFLTIE